VHVRAERGERAPTATMTLLDQVIAGKEPSRRVLIHDSGPHRARDLLVAVADAKLAQGHGAVCVVCLDTFWRDIRLKTHAEPSQLAFVDGIGSITAPHAAQSAAPVVHLDVRRNDLVRAVEAALKRTTYVGHARARPDGKEGGRHTVIIDSLSSLLAFHSPAAVCRALQRISDHPHVKQVVSVVHDDVHDDGTLTAVKHIMSSNIWVKTAPTANQYRGICSVIHRRPAGKILQEESHYRVDGGRLVTRLAGDTTLAVIQVEQESSEHADASSFSLTLTPQQRKAKNELQLPYTHSAERKERELAGGAHTHKPVAAGAIYYEPDDADDFDDEDPDDDLDI